MTTDVAIEKLCALAPIIADTAERLAKDKEFLAFMQKYNKQRTNKIFALNILPILLKNYREEIYKVLAIWGDKTVEEVKAQSVSVTISEVKSLISDEDVRAFFSSSSAKNSTSEK